MESPNLGPEWVIAGPDGEARHRTASHEPFGRCADRVAECTFVCAQRLCQGCYLRPITTHRGGVDFPVEIALNDETEHPKFFIRLQKRICSEFLIQQLGQVLISVNCKSREALE